MDKTPSLNTEKSYNEFLVKNYQPFPWNIVEDHPNDWLNGTNTALNNKVRFEWVVQELASASFNGAKILDVGIYPGVIPQIFRENFDPNFSTRYHGIGLGFTDEFKKEMDKYQIELHELELDQRLTSTQKSLVFPFEENVFDVVIFTDIIEHLFDPLDTLKEINRVLKKNGKLILTTDNLSRFDNVINISRGYSCNVPLAHGHIFYDGPWRPHIREYSREEIVQLLSWSNFDKITHSFQESYFGFFRMEKNEIHKRIPFKKPKLILRQKIKDFFLRVLPQMRDYHFVTANKKSDPNSLLPSRTKDMNDWMRIRKELKAHPKDILKNLKKGRQ